MASSSGYFQWQPRPYLESNEAFPPLKYACPKIGDVPTDQHVVGALTHVVVTDMANGKLSANRHKPKVYTSDQLIDFSAILLHSVGRGGIRQLRPTLERALRQIPYVAREDLPLHLQPLADVPFCDLPAYAAVADNYYSLATKLGSLAVDGGVLRTFEREAIGSLLVQLIEVRQRKEFKDVRLLSMYKYGKFHTLFEELLLVPYTSNQLVPFWSAPDSDNVRIGMSVMPDYRATVPEMRYYWDDYMLATNVLNLNPFDLVCNQRVVLLNPYDKPIKLAEFLVSDWKVRIDNPQVYSSQHTMWTTGGTSQIMNHGRDWERYHHMFQILRTLFLEHQAKHLLLLDIIDRHDSASAERLQRHRQAVLDATAAKKAEEATSLTAAAASASSKGKKPTRKGVAKATTANVNFVPPELAGKVQAAASASLESDCSAARFLPDFKALDQFATDLHLKSPSKLLVCPLDSLHHQRAPQFVRAVSCLSEDGMNRECEVECAGMQRNKDRNQEALLASKAPKKPQQLSRRFHSDSFANEPDVLAHRGMLPPKPKKPLIDEDRPVATPSGYNIYAPELRSQLSKVLDIHCRFREWLVGVRDATSDVRKGLSVAEMTIRKLESMSIKDDAAKLMFDAFQDVSANVSIMMDDVMVYAELMEPYHPLELFHHPTSAMKYCTNPTGLGTKMSVISMWFTNCAGWAVFLRARWAYEELFFQFLLTQELGIPDIAKRISNRLKQYGSDNIQSNSPIYVHNGMTHSMQVIPLIFKDFADLEKFDRSEISLQRPAEDTERRIRFGESVFALMRMFTKTYMFGERCLMNAKFLYQELIKNSGTDKICVLGMMPISGKSQEFTMTHAFSFFNDIDGEPYNYLTKWESTQTFDQVARETIPLVQRHVRACLEAPDFQCFLSIDHVKEVLSTQRLVPVEQSPNRTGDLDPFLSPKPFRTVFIKPDMRLGTAITFKPTVLECETVVHELCEPIMITDPSTVKTVTPILLWQRPCPLPRIVGVQRLSIVQGRVFIRVPVSWRPHADCQLHVLKYASDPSVNSINSTPVRFSWLSTKRDHLVAIDVNMPWQWQCRISLSHTNMEEAKIRHITPRDPQDKEVSSLFWSKGLSTQVETPPVPFVPVIRDIELDEARSVAIVWLKYPEDTTPEQVRSTRFNLYCCKWGGKKKDEIIRSIRFAQKQCFPAPYRPLAGLAKKYEQFTSASAHLFTRVEVKLDRGVVYDVKVNRHRRHDNKLQYLLAACPTIQVCVPKLTGSPRTLLVEQVPIVYGDPENSTKGYPQPSALVQQVFDLKPSETATQPSRAILRKADGTALLAPKHCWIRITAEMPVVPRLLEAGTVVQKLKITLDLMERKRSTQETQPTESPSSTPFSSKIYTSPLNASTIHPLPVGTGTFKQREIVTSKIQFMYDREVDLNAQFSLRLQKINQVQANRVRGWQLTGDTNLKLSLEALMGMHLAPTCVFPLYRQIMLSRLRLRSTCLSRSLTAPPTEYVFHSPDRQWICSHRPHEQACSFEFSAEDISGGDLKTRMLKWADKHFNDQLERPIHPCAPNHCTCLRCPFFHLRKKYTLATKLDEKLCGKVELVRSVYDHLLELYLDVTKDDGLNPRELIHLPVLAEPWFEPVFGKRFLEAVDLKYNRMSQSLLDRTSSLAQLAESLLLLNDGKELRKPAVAPSVSVEMQSLESSINTLSIQQPVVSSAVDTTSSASCLSAGPETVTAVPLIAAAEEKMDTQGDVTKLVERKRKTPDNDHGEDPSEVTDETTQQAAAEAPVVLVTKSKQAEKNKAKKKRQRATRKAAEMSISSASGSNAEAADAVPMEPETCVKLEVESEEKKEDQTSAMETDQSAAAPAAAAAEVSIVCGAPNFTISADILVKIQTNLKAGKIESFLKNNKAAAAAANKCQFVMTCIHKASRKEIVRWARRIISEVFSTNDLPQRHIHVLSWQACELILSKFFEKANIHVTAASESSVNQNVTALAGSKPPVDRDGAWKAEVVSFSNVQAYIQALIEWTSSRACGSWHEIVCVWIGFPEDPHGLLTSTYPMLFPQQLKDTTLSLMLEELLKQLVDLTFYAGFSTETRCNAPSGCLANIDRHKRDKSLSYNWTMTPKLILPIDANKKFNPRVISDKSQSEFRFGASDPMMFTPLVQLTDTLMSLLLFSVEHLLLVRP